MLPLVLLIALGALGFVTPARAEEPQSRSLVKEGPLDVLMREAQQLRYAQRWFQAAALYRKVIAEHGTSDRAPQARFYLAWTLERDQRWDEAATAYTDFLISHPDQRMLGKEAKLSRIACWGIRQLQNPEASTGLQNALEDGDIEVRVNAALQLAKVADKRGIPALQAGASLPNYADRCTMALISLGQKPETPRSPGGGRFLVLNIKEPGKKDMVTMRLSIALARAVTNYLTDEHVRQIKKKGLDLDNLSTQILNSPKGTLLFSVDDGKSMITVTVE